MDHVGLIMSWTLPRSFVSVAFEEQGYGEGVPSTADGAEGVSTFYDGLRADLRETKG